MERHSPILQLIALFLLPYLLSHNLANTTTDLKTDESSLLAFKSHITNDSFDPSLRKNWTTKTSVCNWIGVTCESRHQRVIALNISYMFLEGTIPPHIGNLSFLVSLNITGNRFHGDLPKELTHLHRLRVVDFSNNSFAGELPKIWFGNMTDGLEELHFYRNNFNGRIPQENGHLSNLRVLNMGFNEFTDIVCSGDPDETSIHPHGFKTRPHGSEARSRNQLPRRYCPLWGPGRNWHTPSRFYTRPYGRGSIPLQIGKLVNLEQLYLTSNNLSGSIPPEIGKLVNLEQLYLASNKLSGSIPPEIGKLVNLEQLYLTRNKLSGSIPPEIGKLYNLQRLVLSWNKLSGSIHPEIGKLYNLQQLVLSWNKLSSWLHALLMVLIWTIN